MAKYKVYVSSNEVPDKAVQFLKSIATVRINPKDGPPARDVLLKEVEGVDGLFCLLTEKVDAELLDRAKKLKVVANMAVGYDNINVEEATKRGVMVGNTPGVLTETTADTAFALMLSVARRVVEADNYVRDGKWTIPWTPMMMVGYDVYGKTLGIYGLGRIGYAVAKRAKGFGMRLIYYDAIRNEKAEKELGIEYMPFEDVLRQCDFLTVHVPLLPETRNSVGEKQFAMMKKTAFLINNARGPIVDEPALVKALQEKRIAGAGLDVFWHEPIEKGNALLKMSNVVLLPHVSSGSIETRIAMAMLAAQNIASALKGETPPALVNKEVLQRKKKA
jgi:glyoxylate reductase